jgi:hypothetical protein
MEVELITFVMFSGSRYYRWDETDPDSVVPFQFLWVNAVNMALRNLNEWTVFRPEIPESTLYCHT